MPPRIWPQDPNFKNEAEKALFDALHVALADEDAILCNVRLTDVKEGDREIDLIALVRDLGVVIFETKGGNVSYNGDSFIQSDRHGSRKIDPHAQVLSNLYAFKAFLRVRWPYGNVKTEWMFAFPYSHIGKVEIPGIPRERIADGQDLNNVMANLTMVMNFHSNKKPPNFQNWVDQAFRAVKGHSLLETDPQSHVTNSYLQVKQLTHERRAILEMLQENDRIYVRGPAGSGKSWLAFEQAKIWAEQGLRVGITNFNRGLASYMKRKVTEAGLENQIGFVGHFHQFAESLGEGSELDDSFSDGWLRDPEKVKEVISRLPQNEYFDAWVVDEAQDFDEAWWKLIFSTLKDPEKGKIAIFGDPGQSLYGDKTWPIQGFATIRLSENLRNSQQIAKSVESLVEERVKALGPNSFEVEYIEVESEDDVLSAADDAIVRITEEEFWNPGEIALLTTKYRHPVHEEKRSHQDSYWSDYWEGTDVFYGTVQGFKGLERSVVVLAVNGIHMNANESDLLYVGMTRARDRLVVVRSKRLERTPTKNSHL